MAKKRSSDPAMRELERELQATTQALKDAYLRFDYVCDNDLVESCIFEINALKARSNYLLRQIKQRSGQPVPSGIPQAGAGPGPAARRSGAARAGPAAGGGAAGSPAAAPGAAGGVQQRAGASGAVDIGAHRTGDGADAGRQLVQCADGRGAGSAGAGASAAGEVGAGVG